jgi:hypothetical protein
MGGIVRGVTSETDGVGPVLEAGEVGRAIVQAITMRHADAKIIDRGAYLRVSVPGRCVVRRADLEAVLGRPVSFPSELERVMPSFKGTLAIHVDEVVWSFRPREATVGARP